jgi:hypothetical protein
MARQENRARHPPRPTRRTTASRSWILAVMTAPMMAMDFIQNQKQRLVYLPLNPRFKNLP